MRNIGKMESTEFREIRLKLGLSLTAMGRQLGYQGSDRATASHISAFESGRRVIPTYVGQLMRMLRIYGIPPEGDGNQVAGPSTITKSDETDDRQIG